MLEFDLSKYKSSDGFYSSNGKKELINRVVESNLIVPLVHSTGSKEFFEVDPLNIKFEFKISLDEDRIIELGQQWDNLNLLLRSPDHISERPKRGGKDHLIASINSVEGLKTLAFKVGFKVFAENNAAGIDELIHGIGGVMVFDLAKKF